MRNDERWSSHFGILPRAEAGSGAEGMTTKRKRETAKERDERIVAKAWPWKSGGFPSVGNARPRPLVKMLVAADAAARVLNRLRRKR